jgi:hypothetical protein
MATQKPNILRPKPVPAKPNQPPMKITWRPPQHDK